MAKWVLGFFVLVGPFVNAGDVLITEFVAENRSGLQDEDGVQRDWIEIFNNSESVINLEGWHLTDSTNDLTKWSFPVYFLDPKEYLVVFASGNNRSNTPFHTNFSLDNDGEYLAVIEPDGATVSHEYTGGFPLQFADVSFGLEQSSLVTNLVAGGATGTYMVPSDGTLGATWTQAGFDDTGWTSAVSGIGYDGSGNFSSLINTDVLGVLSNVNASLYFRVPFTVTAPIEYDRLTLHTLYDDGYVAYVNGSQVATDNAPVSPTWNDSALGDNSGGLLIDDWEQSETPFVVDVQSAPAPSFLQDAGDTFVRLVFNGSGGNRNHIHFDRTDVGAYTEVGATLDFRMVGTADGFSLLFIPTSVYGETAAGGTRANPGIAEEPNVPETFAIGVDIYSNIDEISLHYGTTRAENNLSGAIDLNNNIWHRMQCTFIADPGGGTRVNLSVIPNIRGVPGTPVDFFVDEYISDLDPYEYRIQLSARTGGATANMDIDKLSVNRSGPNGALRQTVHIDSAINDLQAGSNVLALHGLNHSPTNPDFLLLPELVAETIGEPETSAPKYFDAVSPGNPNGVGTLGLTAPVIFSEPSRIISSTEGPINLVLTSAQSNATIYYTVDGSVPELSDMEYTGPIAINANTQVRARAFAPNYSPSIISAERYIKLNANAEPGAYDSNLPIVVVSNFGAGGVPNPGSARQPGLLAIFEPDINTGRTSLTNAPTLVTRAGFRNRGSSSLGRPKKSMSFDAWDEYEQEQSINPLGLPGESDWILYGPYNFDRALMRNPFVYRISNDAGRYAARTRYVELFLDTNGGQINYTDDYWGVYVLMEELKRDDDRIDISRLEVTDNAAPDITGGYIWRRDRLGPGEQGFNAGGLSFIYDYPDETRISQPQADYLTGVVNDAKAALDGPDFSDPVLGYAAHIDVDSFVDHWWLNVLPMDVDAFRLSGYWYKPRNEKIVLGPVWDFDRSMGSYDSRDDDPEVWGTTGGFTFFNYGWFDRLFQDPDWEQALVDRWVDLRKDVFTTNHFNAVLDGFTAEIQEAAVRNFAKWTAVPPMPDFDGEVDSLKDWLTRRISFIDGEMPIVPQYNQDGGTAPPGFVVTLSAPPGEVYYTIDGSDPRAPGGAPAASASLYTGGVTINSTTRFRARTRNTAFTRFTWSGENDVTFNLNQPAGSGTLAITEINYNPYARTAEEINAGYLDDDVFEFIELWNLSNETIDLAGLQFIDGVSFAFDTGSILTLGTNQPVLVVRNPDAFALRYGTNLPVTGSFSGGLSKRGENITLVDGNTNVIHNFTYDDKSPWPEGPDGNGPTLQVIDTSGNYNSFTNWYPSAEQGGTPGTWPSLSVDQDGDNLPDVYELYHVGVTGLLSSGNLDGDALTDEEEYVAGTDPTQPDTVELSVGTTNISFLSRAVSGPGYEGQQRKFRLEEKFPLNAPTPWLAPAGWMDVIGNDQMFVWPSPASNNTYRLRIWLE